MIVDLLLTIFFLLDAYFNLKDGRKKMATLSFIVAMLFLINGVATLIGV